MLCACPWCSKEIQSCKMVLNCYKLKAVEVEGEVQISDGDLEETIFDVDQEFEDDFLFCNKCNCRVKDDELIAEEIGHESRPVLNMTM